ncbi:MAG TPA: L,D-transpeptidase family protein [Myxococcota bacterium]|nr:L,D-transpeptidase family protein [Myxococcota bacterium]
MLAPVQGAESYEFTHEDDTLLDVAARASVGFIPLHTLNPDVDVWIPPENTRLRLPTDYILPDAPHVGLVINVPELRLYDYTQSADSPTVLAVAVGDIGDQTPIQDFRVGGKRVDPVWNVPESIRAERPDLPAAVPPGPDNPLGDRWLTLGATSYGIHGTNNLWSIGREATHGCVRLYNSDMRALFDRIPIGTPVRIMYQRVKIGQRDGSVFVEAHDDRYDRDFDPLPATLARLVALDALGLVDGGSIKESEVRRVVTESRGIPIRVGRLFQSPAP